MSLSIGRQDQRPTAIEEHLEMTRVVGVKSTVYPYKVPLGSRQNRKREMVATQKIDALYHSVAKNAASGAAALSRSLIIGSPGSQNFRPHHSPSAAKPYSSLLSYSLSKP